MTNEIGNYEHIIIAFISSNLDSNLLDSDFLVSADTKPSTGLKVDSIIKLQKIVTIPKKLIKRKLGELDLKDRDIINKKLIQLFELK